MIIGVMAAFYFQHSSRVFANRLIQRALAGDESAKAVFNARAAAPLVRAAVGRELTGDGAFRARRLLYRWREELSPNLKAVLDSAGYWQEA